jgi:hypothetical protein
MGDFSCALFNSTRDTETLRVTTLTSTQFWVQNLLNDGSVKNFDLEIQKPYDWLNRTD